MLCGTGGTAQVLQAKERKKAHKLVLDACKRVRKEAKKVKAPQKAATAYRLLISHPNIVSQLQANHPHATDTELSQLRRQLWASLGSDGQRPYRDAAKLDKLRLSLVTCH